MSLEKGSGHRGSNHFGVQNFNILGSGRSKDHEPSAARIVGSRIPKSQKVDRGGVDFSISGPGWSRGYELGDVES
jgi:hypothetical protein